LALALTSLVVVVVIVTGAKVSGGGLFTTSEGREFKRLALVAELDEAELSRRLYPAAGATMPSRPSAWIFDRVVVCDHVRSFSLMQSKIVRCQDSIIRSGQKALGSRHIMSLFDFTFEEVEDLAKE
jgi:hypothetical protein